MLPAHTFVKTAGLAAVAIGYLFQAGWIRFQYPDPTRYPVRGIDLSHHQGEIDWSKTASAGLAFAYIKASEGGDYRDRSFQANWRGAQAAGLAPGAYHFFTLCKPGAVQARNFLEALGKVRGPMLPPAVDLEFTGNCSKRPEPKEVAAQLEAFLDRVERGVGARPVLYLTDSFYKEYATALPEKNPRWVRSVFRPPENSFGDGWTFWQFAARARVPGIPRVVDLDVFKGSEGEWRLFLREHLRLHPEEPSGTST